MLSYKQSRLPGFLSFLFLLASLISFSQDTLKLKPPDEYNYLVPQQVIKLSVVHPLFFYPSMQVAYEFKLSRRLTFQADVGYVFNHRAHNPKFENKRGVKLKTELRYYLQPDMNQNRINYYSIEPYANFINFGRQETVTECFDLDCAILYSRKYSYQMKYREAGFSLKNGYVVYFNKFVVDFNFGLALRFVNYIKPDLGRPGSILFGDDNLNSGYSPIESRRIALGPVLDLRFGYRLR